MEILLSQRLSKLSVFIAFFGTLYSFLKNYIMFVITSFRKVKHLYNHFIAENNSDKKHWRKKGDFIQITFDKWGDAASSRN